MGLKTIIAGCYGSQSLSDCSFFYFKKKEESKRLHTKMIMQKGEAIVYIDSNTAKMVASSKGSVSIISVWRLNLI